MGEGFCLREQCLFCSGMPLGSTRLSAICRCKKDNVQCYKYQKVRVMRAVRFELTHLSIVELSMDLNLPP